LKLRYCQPWTDNNITSEKKPFSRRRKVAKKGLTSIEWMAVKLKDKQKFDAGFLIQSRGAFLKLLSLFLFAAWRLCARQKSEVAFQLYYE
jgi:hypothetical protein